MRTFTREERIGQIARRQGGVVSRGQLAYADIPSATVARCIARGYLTRLLPRVYAVGHTAPSRESDLWAAVLYAGPGAMLSHASAAHKRGLIIYAPSEIHVSTPRCKIRSVPGVVRVHVGRELERDLRESIPTTTNVQTVLDLAADPRGSTLVRRALAVLEYRNELDVVALDAICGKGRAGSRALRQALEIHRPELAYTNGELEEAFLHLCERFGLQIPQCNRWMYGFPVDAYWPDQNLIAEVDGLDAHSKAAQLRNDRRKELTLREHGHTVVRYDWTLVKTAAVEVYEDLVRLGVPTGPAKPTIRVP
jgi:predicted transcriptional regulator of viral defense system